MLKHAGQACHADMLCRSVDDMLVHLICYHKGIVLDCKGGNGLQLVPAEHLAARGWRGCTGSVPWLPPQSHFRSEKYQTHRWAAPAGDIDRLGTGEDGVCPIVLVERRKRSSPCRRGCRRSSWRSSLLRCCRRSRRSRCWDPQCGAGQGWSFWPALRGSSLHRRSQRTGAGRHRLFASASSSCFGGSKSGKPCERLMESY